jgi:hypothetical protein
MVDSHQKRRLEDSILGRIVYFWPLTIGIMAFLTSVGGYIATVHYMGDHINKIESWITEQSSATEERNTILGRLTTLQEVTDKRLNSLEDWRDDKRRR